MVVESGYIIPIQETVDVNQITQNPQLRDHYTYIKIFDFKGKKFLLISLNGAIHLRHLHRCLTPVIPNLTSFKNFIVVRDPCQESYSMRLHISLLPSVASNIKEFVQIIHQFTDRHKTTQEKLYYQILSHDLDAIKRLIMFLPHIPFTDNYEDRFHASNKLLDLPIVQFSNISNEKGILNEMTQLVTKTTNLDIVSQIMIPKGPKCTLYFLAKNRKDANKIIHSFNYGKIGDQVVYASRLSSPEEFELIRKYQVVINNLDSSILEYDFYQQMEEFGPVLEIRINRHQKLATGFVIFYDSQSAFDLYNNDHYFDNTDFVCKQIRLFNFPLSYHEAEIAEFFSVEESNVKLIEKAEPFALHEYTVTFESPDEVIKGLNQLNAWGNDASNIRPCGFAIESYRNSNYEDLKEKLLLGKSIYMSGIDPEVTPQQFYKLITQYGCVTLAFLNQNNNRVYAIVAYETKKSAQKAIGALNNLQFLSKSLLVNEYKYDRDHSAKSTIASVAKTNTPKSKIQHSQQNEAQALQVIQLAWDDDDDDITF
ncbi:hypothetical protein TRFO_07949 [Tritrichomonas foetus]|uniref:RRM domain-containing protein n=1 Tax=Tritrichomonas foetus TaxID=1144522 RepID=A0A1J4JMF5_9EUKA|nr:hypothetical protein TRFO_07949 [Tritrichomonas foetus]|eukprot:OHT00297.1 hypothetical protein TRFO_07949 [Tritrichomonas foetus]